MKIFRSFICFLLAIILIISSVVLQFAISFNHDLFSESFYNQKIDKSKIYDKLEKSIDVTFSDYALSNKISTSATTGIISSKWVQAQATTIIHGLIPYMQRKTDTFPEIDTNSSIDIFNSNLTKKLAEKNTPMDNKIAAAKLEFLNSYSKIPFSKAWNDINGDDTKDMLNNYRKYVPILSYIPFIAALLLIGSAILLFVATPKLLLWKLWTGYSLMISGLITSLTSFYISNSSTVSDFLANNLVIAKSSIFPPKATTDLLTNIINGFFMNATKFGGAMILVGIVILLVLSLFDTKKDTIFWYKHKPLN